MARKKLTLNFAILITVVYATQITPLHQTKT